MSELLFFILGYIIGGLSIISSLYFKVEKKNVIELPRLKDEHKM